MNISFIVPLYNEESTVPLCIKSILSQCHEGDEVIVVDNGSTDNSLRSLSQFENVSVIVKPGITVAAVRNAGASVAKGEVLAFVDADCILSPSWRKTVLSTLSDNSVSATGSKVDIPDNAMWIERAWYSQRNAKCAKVSYINSGNLVVKKNIFMAVGGFSENLVTGEDSELGWRINKAGWEIVDNPAIRSIHLGNPKKLKDFYEKEKWHALGMMGTFQVSFFDKPLIMTGVFSICNLLAVAVFLGFCVAGDIGSGFISFVTLSLSVPFSAAVYRAIQFQIFRNFFQLIFLYWVYFFARSNVLGSILWKNLKEKFFLFATE